ncbi:hypothetical protein BpHYR1_036042 [Brachionus plicatilis]|uniref:Uncharacterized protein n=1 Tax=Brachionus plicatilis TaxID=10195 RepID=A0A3M7RZ11_BRAPC|nr:hypothetical protein BpHYR1_036042 [Brachionus plicatilis]
MESGSKQIEVHHRIFDHLIMIMNSKWLKDSYYSRSCRDLRPFIDSLLNNKCVTQSRIENIDSRLPGTDARTCFSKFDFWRSNKILMKTKK